MNTEYSVTVGEIYPLKNWHSGIVAIDAHKFDYVFKNNVLQIGSRKEDLAFSIELNEATLITSAEFFVLLFSTVKVMTKSEINKTKGCIF